MEAVRCLCATVVALSRQPGRRGSVQVALRLAYTHTADAAKFCGARHDTVLERASTPLSSSASSTFVNSQSHSFSETHSLLDAPPP